MRTNFDSELKTMRVVAPAFFKQQHLFTHTTCRPLGEPWAKREGNATMDKIMHNGAQMLSSERHAELL